MPYNHAIRQAKQILYNNTATNRPAHTTPQSSYAGQLQNQQQTATHKTVTYVNIVRQGRAFRLHSDKIDSDLTQTNTLQLLPDKHAMHETSADIRYTTHYGGHTNR